MPYGVSCYCGHDTLEHIGSTCLTCYPATCSGFIHNRHYPERTERVRAKPKAAPSQRPRQRQASAFWRFIKSWRFALPGDKQLTA